MRHRRVVNRTGLKVLGVMGALGGLAASSACGRDVVVGTAAPLAVLTQQTAAELTASGKVDVVVSGHGSSSALRMLCAGYADAAAVDRAINAEERALCAEHRVDVVELPLAWDALVVVVNRGNTLGHLTTAQLASLWNGDSASREPTQWGAVKPGWEGLPIRLHAPETLVDSEVSMLAALSPDGGVPLHHTSHALAEDVLTAVAADPVALGLVPYSVFNASAEPRTVRVVALDDGKDGNGQGAFMPTQSTLEAGTYLPFVHPWVLYLSARSLRRQPVRAYALAYLAAVEQAGSGLHAVPLSPRSRRLTLTRLERRLPGRVLQEPASSTLSPQLLEQRMENVVAASDLLVRAASDRP